MEIYRRQSPEVLRKRYVAIAKEYNKGTLIKDIAKKFKCSKEAVYYALRKIENLSEEDRDA